jgi:catechol 2,3-dioxygenase-like lactoylglutathione lyase family enzyme
MIRGIHHLAIATLEIKRTSAFYVDLFGHDCSAHSVMLLKGNAYIELLSTPAPSPAPSAASATPA